MSTPGRTNSLGTYLRERRAEISPEDVGLPTPTNARRRARGLRREEVAALAALSTDYYTRIEQGRRSAPPATLEAIAKALRIDDDGLQYMVELSTSPPTPGTSTSDPQKVSPTLTAILGDLTTLPAIVLGHRMDILAWNEHASRLLVTDLERVPASQRNYARLLFTRPEVRSLYSAWEQTGRACVFQLHMETARDPADQKLAQLVGELSIADVDFRTWWSEHQVVAGNGGIKTFRHPEVGDMHLTWETLELADDPGQRLITWHATPNSTSHRRLTQLARDAV